MLDYALAFIDQAIDPSDQNQSRLSLIEDELREQSRPFAIYGTRESPVVESKLSMEALYAALEERGVPNPRQLTEFELYSRLQYYRKQKKDD